MKDIIKQQIDTITSIKELLNEQYENRWKRAEIIDIVRYAGQIKFNVYLVVYVTAENSLTDEMIESDFLFDIEGYQDYFWRGIHSLIKEGVIGIKNEQF